MITSLQYFALGVPEIQVGIDFYDAFGLETVERKDHVAMRCHGRDQDQIVLVETGKSRKLHHFSLGSDEAGMSGLKTRLEARGIALLPPPYQGAPDGLWFHDPEGTLVNVQAAATMPWLGDTEVPKINRPGLISRRGEKGCPPFDMQPRPRRMGHIIVFARDVIAQTAFYCDVIGLRLSDRITDGYAAFLRTPNDSDHHVLALMKSEAPGFHHASFEMSNVDAAEVAAVQLFAMGYKHAWGPGRHGVGSNYFHYFRDPWNGLAEYFYDMDYIPEAYAWEVGDWSKKDGMFLWSADGSPPPDFSKNFELE